MGTEAGVHRSPDKNLTELGVSADFIKEAKRPVLNFASWDIYHVLIETAHVLSQGLRMEIAARQHAIFNGGPIDPTHPEWSSLQKNSMDLLVPRKDFGDMSAQTDLENMRGAVSEIVNDIPWPQKEKAILEQVGGEVETLASACWQQGTITPEAQAYIERYSFAQDARLKELVAASCQ